MSNVRRSARPHHLTGPHRRRLFFDIDISSNLVYIMETLRKGGGEAARRNPHKRVAVVSFFCKQ